MSEYAPDVQVEPVAESERMILVHPGTEWKVDGLCSNFIAVDAVYDTGRQGRKTTNGLKKSDEAFIRDYCGPCPVAEQCLTMAILYGDEESGINGGLTPRARTALLKHFDAETSSIAKTVWAEAIESVLEVRLPEFPGAEQTRVSAVECREKLLDHLSNLPGKSLEVEKGAKVVEQLSIALDLPVVKIREAILFFEVRGTLTKQFRGHSISVVRLVA